MQRNPSTLPATPNTRAASTHATSHAKNAPRLEHRSTFKLQFSVAGKAEQGEQRLRWKNPGELQVYKAKQTLHFARSQVPVCPSGSEMLLLNLSLIQVTRAQ